MAQSVPIAALAVASTPEDYLIPDSIEIVPLAVRASYDGSGASGPYYATLEIITPGGAISAECPCFTTIPAGGSADVTWFHLDEGQTIGPAQSTYEILVLSNPHLRAYYKLDETAGTVMLDSGPLALTGSYQASPTLGQPPLADGHSVTFAGASLQFGSVLNSTGLAYQGEFTVAAWIKTTGNGGSEYMAIVNVDDNNFRYFQFRINLTNHLELVTFTTAAPTSGTTASAATVTDGNKHFVVGTFNSAKTAKIYIDGSLDTSSATGQGGVPSTRVPVFQLAGRLVGGPPVQYPYTGTLDEVAIYNYELPAADIAALYAAGV